MRKTLLVIALLNLMPGLMLAACGQDGTKPTQTAAPSSLHERMIQDMERTGAGGGGGGGGGGAGM
jgi:hypothetical protein